MRPLPSHPSLLYSLFRGRAPMACSSTQVLSDRRYDDREHPGELFLVTIDHYCRAASAAM